MMESDTTTEEKEEEEEEEDDDDDEDEEVVKEESMFEIKDGEAAITCYYSEDALMVGLCKLTWLGGHMAVLAALFWGIFLIIRFTFLWRLNVYSRVATERSSWEASIVVGTEVGLLAMAVLLVLLIPRMIMTWTTALVFEFIFGRGHGRQEVIVEDGSKMAVELSISTLKRVVREGNRVAFTVALLCLLSALFSKYALYFENEMISMR
ncbi:hypothetical protein O6H91_04G137500 [Diphasiastrum complanatum]|uniref:Uncharacterized protein n=1 Tax=Diphasiastrum complanatum TaxID=34168 RepID=A0ACC2E2V6_DIPCM|nr:hypothetical protein O6H91_04G137500 [Diphasiastrum complanatum]